MRRIYTCIALLALLVQVGCDAETSNRRTVFGVSMVGVGADAAIATNSGWQVTLSAAKLRIGQITFYSGAPLTGSRTKSLPARLLAWLWPISTAHAHPGHYNEGVALAELNGDTEVDLLGDPISLGEAAGVTGDYRSFTIDVGASGATNLTLAGTATKAGQTVTFSAALDLTETLQGASADQAIASSLGGRTVIEVSLDQWVRRIDFDAILGTDVDLNNETQAFNALVRGAYSSAAFHALWEQ